MQLPARDRSLLSLFKTDERTAWEITASGLFAVAIVGWIDLVVAGYMFASGPLALLPQPTDGLSYVVRVWQIKPLWYHASGFIIRGSVFVWVVYYYLFPSPARIKAMGGGE